MPKSFLFIEEIDLILLIKHLMIKTKSRMLQHIGIWKNKLLMEIYWNLVFDPLTIQICKTTFYYCYSCIMEIWFFFSEKLNNPDYCCLFLTV